MPATGTAIFTICARNYYPLARTLAQSVRRFHPDATFVLCVVDEPGSPADTADFDEVFPSLFAAGRRAGRPASRGEAVAAPAP